MKNIGFVFFVIIASLMSLPVFSQTEDEVELLGLPGDNLDLYAVLDLFQKSKTIEDFQETLNEKETGINNLDLNLDGNVDFIKVVTEQKGEDFTFILQDDISADETQDVAVILLSKDKDANVTLQIVGDEALYGKDFVVEPAPAVTPNPAYTGNNPVTESSASNVVVVQSAPIVQYVYSPVYVPYYPPYYYGYYPPYFFAFSVISVSVYHHHNYYHHYGAYRGGYGRTTVVIHNHNTYNNYRNTRNTSTTVNRNNAGGNYNKGNRPSNRSLNKPSTRPANPSKPAASARPSNPSVKSRPSNPNASTRQTPSTTKSTNNYRAAGRSGGVNNKSGNGGRAGAGAGAGRGGKR